MISGSIDTPPPLHPLTAMQIRSATRADFDAMWPIFQAVVATGTTYVFSATTNSETAFDYWFGNDAAVFVAEDDGKVVGMYKLIPNQSDRGAHVANASFMVDPARSGNGIGKAMGLHCLKTASEAGYAALQFNFVVSTNDAAVALWKSLGFVIVGTLPKVFQHQQRGLVDAYVMHRFLDGRSEPDR
jgi:L-amino acid N-acyltransferase YncA